ncbi:MAG: TlpA family protein disulfide reductase [Deltaproteobacteria bacterium]|nr:TlpA family protein disulfide reductase [Deltaproteobacteria bacterium]
MYSAKTVILTLLSALAAVALFLTTPAEAAPKPGQTAPAFKVTAITGQSITLDSYRGQVLLLDFFATWCQPCRQSIPHLVEMSRKYGGQGLQVLGLSADVDGAGVVKAFAGEYGIRYPLALADDTVTADFGVRSVPVMIVIDKKGKVAEIYRGYSNEMGRSLEKLLKRLLAEK